MRREDLLDMRAYIQIERERLARIEQLLNHVERIECENKNLTARLEIYAKAKHWGQSDD